MGVIWCNYLGDGLFQVYVMNFVENVLDFYSHITSHVSQVFASYTPYTSYSLLNFVHVIVCFWNDQPSFKIPWVLCKTYLLLENLRECLKIVILGNLGLKLVFWKAFHLILMHFILKIQCFEEFLYKIFLFFKNLIFPEFRSIEHVFRSIEIVIKNWSGPLSVSIDRTYCFDQLKIAN